MFRDGFDVAAFAADGNRQKNAAHARHKDAAGQQALVDALAAGLMGALGASPDAFAALGFGPAQVPAAAAALAADIAAGRF